MGSGDDKFKWFKGAGLGMFIHWGVSAAIGRGGVGEMPGADT